MTTRRDFLGALPALPAGLPLASDSAGTLQGNQGASCDVLTFGATGDGTTDDTGALKAAVEACPRNGRLVFPPARRYRLGRIEIRKNLVVDAIGATVVLHGREAGFWVHGAISFFRVLGGTIIGNGRAEDRQIGWQFGNLPDDQISDVIVDGVTAQDCSVGIKVAGRADAPVHHLTVRDCRILHSVGLGAGTGYGVQFTHGNYGKAIGCHFERCERHELYFTEGRHYTAVGNTFRAHRDGVSDGSMLVALAVARSDNVSVVGNIFDGCLDGTLGIETDSAGPTCRNVTVTGNGFQNSGSFDILVGNDDPAGHGRPQNVVIVGNAFLRDPGTPTGTAIDVRNVALLTIASNTFFHEAAGPGAPTAVQLRGIGGDQFTQSVIISGNTFRGTAPRGEAAAVEIGAPIARGESTVHVTGNINQTARGVRVEGRATNRNLRIGP